MSNKSLKKRLFMNKKVVWKLDMAGRTVLNVLRLRAACTVHVKTQVNLVLPWGFSFLVGPVPFLFLLFLFPGCLPGAYLNYSKRREYILEGNLENLSVWVFSVPFSLKGSSKCTHYVNVHKLYAVEYINTVCSLDYPFQFRIF